MASTYTTFPGRDQAMFRRWQRPTRFWSRITTVKVGKSAIRFESCSSHEEAAHALRLERARLNGRRLKEGHHRADGNRTCLCRNESGSDRSSASEPERRSARGGAHCGNQRRQKNRGPDTTLPSI